LSAADARLFSSATICLILSLFSSEKPNYDSGILRSNKCFSKSSKNALVSLFENRSDIFFGSLAEIKGLGKGLITTKDSILFAVSCFCSS
jgi:hypothetical protein